MITDIHLENYHLKFNNSRKELVECPVSDGYNGVFTYLQYNNELICILIWDENSTNEQRRRNVVKIDEDGKIVWTVADTMNIWEPKFPDNQVFLESVARTSFNNVWFKDGKIILYNGRGEEFFLNPATGGIEFWKAGKF